MADPTNLELVAIREALMWIKDRRRPNVVIESDCLVVVEWIRKGVSMNSALGEIVKDCVLLVSTLVIVRVIYIRRTANRVAHTLTRASRSFSNPHV